MFHQSFMINQMNGLKGPFNFVLNMFKIHIPKYFTAAVLFKTNSKLKLINLKVPKLQTGQVLVKIFYSGICKSQIMEIFGGRENKKWLPHLLGHEASGKVVQVGNNVKKVKPNDDVILTWIKSNKINTDFELRAKWMNATDALANRISSNISGIVINQFAVI